ncbi:uncharacterized protein LOC127587148 [Pristis pectinata]|uniref:uncharacterized protein LOC127587148 n=1 Tax=Pristis pectinata TaxID=685728 RepID=UPI00223D0EA3|nr:uncharacterized protein LOC127587148 [Pristis pectinata]
MRQSGLAVEELQILGVNILDDLPWAQHRARLPEFTIHVERSQINVAVGDDALLSVRPSAKVRSGYWHFGEQAIAVWNADGNDYVNGYQSQSRLFPNGSLLLNSVKVSDSGTYRVHMNPSDGSQTMVNIILEVSATSTTTLRTVVTQIVELHRLTSGYRVRSRPPMLLGRTAICAFRFESLRLCLRDNPFPLRRLQIEVAEEGVRCGAACEWERVVLTVSGGCFSADKSERWKRATGAFRRCDSLAELCREAAAAKRPAAKDECCYAEMQKHGFPLLLCTLCIAAVKPEPSELEVERHLIYAAVGAPIALQANISSGSRSGTWRFSCRDIAVWIGNMTDINNDYSDRAELLSNGSLTLRSLAVNDSGEYVVTANPPFSNFSFTSRIELNVVVPVSKPTVVANLSEVLEGNGTVTLSCELTGDLPVILWMKDGKWLQYHDRMNITADNQTVTITAVNRSDSGSYQCEGHNSLVEKQAMNYG